MNKTLTRQSLPGNGKEAEPAIEPFRVWLARIGVPEQLINQIENDRGSSGEQIKRSRITHFEQVLNSMILTFERELGNGENQQAVLTDKARAKLPEDSESFTYERGFAVFVTTRGELGYVAYVKGQPSQVSLYLPDGKRLGGEYTGEWLEVGRSFSESPALADGIENKVVMTTGPIILLAEVRSAVYRRTGKRMNLPYERLKLEQQAKDLIQQIREVGDDGVAEVQSAMERVIAELSERKL